MANEELRAIQITAKEAENLQEAIDLWNYKPGETYEVIDQRTLTKRTLLFISAETARKMPGQAVQMGEIFFLIEGAEALEIVADRWNIHKRDEAGQVYTLAEDGETWLKGDDWEIISAIWNGNELAAEAMADKLDPENEEIYIANSDNGIVVDRFEAEGLRGKWAK